MRIVGRLRAIIQYKAHGEGDDSSLSYDSEDPNSSDSRFPMFHALPLWCDVRVGGPARFIANHAITQLTGLSLASAFGAIHCIAWNLQIGTSHIPLLLWRISSLCVTASPVPLMPTFLLVFLFQWPVGIRVWRTFPSALWYVVICSKKIGQIVIFLYVPARVILISLAFYDLAWLTPSAHRTVEWSSFVPHI